MTSNFWRWRRSTALSLLVIVAAATADVAVAAGNARDGAARVVGCQSRGYLGERVAAAGDVNGDGVQDWLVSAQSARHGPGTGSVYVVFGAAGSVRKAMPVCGPGFRGFRIDGGHSYDYAEEAARTGDVNGDGLDDVLVGAEKASVTGETSGAAYVVYGKRDERTVDLGSLGAFGYEITGGGPGEQFGTAVAGGVDLNQDGIPDQVIGAPEASPGGRTGAGSVYVVYGQRGGSLLPLPKTVAAAYAGGFRVDGQHRDDAFGSVVAITTDVTGDGVPEVLVGAPHASPRGRRSAGRAYCYDVAASTPLSGGPARLVSRIDGAKPYDGLGSELVGGSRRGDPAVVVGAPGLLQEVEFGASASPGATTGTAGHAYVLMSVRPALDVRHPPAATMVLRGEQAGSHLGSALALARAHHTREIVLGTRGASAPGAAYVVPLVAGERTRVDRAHGVVALRGSSAAEFGWHVATDASRQGKVAVTAPAYTRRGGPDRVGQVTIYPSPPRARLSAKPGSPPVGLWPRSHRPRVAGRPAAGNTGSASNS